MGERHGGNWWKALGAITLILILGAAPGWAALGEPESSVSADGKILQGHIRDEVHPGYRLYQITDASGSVIREYVSPAGRILVISLVPTNLTPEVVQ